MSEKALRDLHRIFRRRDVALWLGPDGHGQAARPHLMGISWLGVWTEGGETDVAQQMKSRWESDDILSRRLILSITGRPRSFLGRAFSYADICPFFFLADVGEKRSRRQRDQMRFEMLDHLEALGQSTLLIGDYDDGHEVANLIVDELSGEELQLDFVVTGLDEEQQAAFGATLLERDRGLIPRVSIFEDSIDQLLQRVSNLEGAPGDDPYLQVGGRRIDLMPLLDRERPLDQDFFILTNRELSMSVASEVPATDREILEEFLSGSAPPWRALARDLLWRRFDGQHPIKLVLRLAKAVKENRYQVACLSIPGHRGSGLTTLLQSTAFHVAVEGYATFIKRPERVGFQYDALRDFLEQLDEGGGGLGSGIHPAILVFDDTDSFLDDENSIRDLPQRLARDGRRAVVIRGINIESRKPRVNKSFRKQYGVRASKHTRVMEVWFDPVVQQEITKSEVSSLVKWASKHWNVEPETLGKVIQTWGKGWQTSSETEAVEQPPLLISLYYLLRQQVRSAQGFGRHILNQIADGLVECDRGSDALNRRDDDGPLSEMELQDALRMLRDKFASGATDFKPKPIAQDVISVLTVLSSLASMRTPIPRSILADVISISGDRLDSVVALLVRHELASVGLRVDQQATGMHARTAYYDTHLDTVGLRYPAFGRLILSLVQIRTHPVAEAFYHNSLYKELSYQASVEDYPLRLLMPILRRLSPNDSHVDFARVVSSRWLRFQRVRGSHYHSWLFQQAHKRSELLLEVLGAIPEPVVRMSSVILHTRALTRYKSSHRDLPLEAGRDRYRLASLDLDAATRRTREEPRGELEANVVTSHGLVYLNWAKREKEHEAGSPDLAAQASAHARQYLRAGLKLRYDNPFAAYGLAEFLIDEYEEMGESQESGAWQERGAKLAEALELLQADPQESYVEDWEVLKRRAISLLSDKDAEDITASLRSSGHELGYALQALRALGGNIPSTPVSRGSADEDGLRKAWSILLDAETITFERPSPLAAFLRYTVFSSLPDRWKKPNFGRRLSLLSPLASSRFMDQPRTLYDLGMLFYQERQFESGREIHVRLRKARRFLGVPLERVMLLREKRDPLKDAIVQARVVSEARDGRGWVELQELPGVRENASFSGAMFREQGRDMTSGYVATGHLQIRPSGLRFIPLQRGR